MLSLKPNHLKSYPSYPRVKGFWSHLERCSGEQMKRLDHHLRFVCLRDSGELLPRRNAAEVVIDALLDVYKLRDMLFYRLDVNGVTQELSDGDIRVLDGVIESSIDFVECIAGCGQEINTSSTTTMIRCWFIPLSRKCAPRRFGNLSENG